MKPRMTILSVLTLLFFSAAAGATPLQIYGAWHCGNDACTWGTVRNMTDFDTNNHWMIDRGDGVPSVNLVVLSFVNPLKLLNQTNDTQTVNGVPGKGGSIDGSGPVISGGMLFVNSGYPRQGGMTGNVLLAFGSDE